MQKESASAEYVKKEKILKMQNAASFILHGGGGNHKTKLKGIPSHLQQTQRLFIILHVVLQIIIKF